MRADQFTIGFVRRGFSSGGGAESYLRRLAGGIVEQGHRAVLFTAGDWPEKAWNFGPIERIAGSSAIDFADALRKAKPREQCDLLFSLERIWECDVYRAGDGVHRAWLERRNAVAGRWQKLSRYFNRKHTATLALEESLFAKHGAKRVIANSRMVKEEIVRLYGYPARDIDVVYNGVPQTRLEQNETDRAKARRDLGLKEDDIAVLFAGSGWERKGLRFALEAVERQESRMRFIVAGRGERAKFSSARASFLGVVEDMPALYRAADIFLLPTLYDPFSNACLEALAAGLPVITTRANGFSEIIENGRHGTAIENPGDINAISAALQFWSNPARRAQAQIDNLSLAAQFDISRNVAETLQILQISAAK
jgi:UDP-glucose:(heptosyl)LPS alpha-1,3-glucosyltransferase